MKISLLEEFDVSNIDVPFNIPPPPQEDLPKKDTIQHPITDESIFIVVEKPAEPIGGYNVLRTRAKYTNTARQSNIEGIVVVNFVVNIQGKAERIQIIAGLPGGLNEEVIKALQNTRFKPAIQSGKKVKQQLSMRFIFRLKF